MNYYFISKKDYNGREIYGARIVAKNLKSAKESEIFKRELESLRGTKNRLEIHKLPTRKWVYVIQLIRNGECVLYDEVYAVSEKGAKLTGGYQAMKKSLVPGESIKIDCDYKQYEDF